MVYTLAAPGGGEGYSFENVLMDQGEHIKSEPMTAFERGWTHIKEAEH